MTHGPSAALNLHASCVAIAGRGLLILGPSGAGKSALALQLMAMGAELVADDRTLVSCEGDQLWGAAPAALKGLIEARFVGLLHAPSVAAVRLVLAVDLAHSETQRLPPYRSLALAGIDLPLVHKAAVDHFPFALLCYVKYGRHG